MKRFLVFYIFFLVCCFSSAILFDLQTAGTIRGSAFVPFLPFLIFFLAVIVRIFIPYMIYRGYQKSWSVMADSVKKRNEEIMNRVNN